MTKLYALLALFLSAPALADPPTPTNGVICGGTYHGEDLQFRANALTGVLAAFSSNDDLMVFIDLSRPDRVKVTYATSVSDELWEKLKALWTSMTDQELKETLTRLSSLQQTQVWTGWTGDGYVLFEVEQAKLKFSFACRKAAN